MNDDVKKGEFNRNDVIDSFLGKKEEKEIEQSKSVKQFTVEKAFDEMLSTKNIEMKTDITKATVVELSKAETMIALINIPSMRIFVDNYNKYSVSKGRKGREEVVKLTTNSNSLDEMTPDNGFEKMKNRLM